MVLARQCAFVLVSCVVPCVAGAVLSSCMPFYARTEGLTLKRVYFEKARKTDATLALHVTLEYPAPPEEYFYLEVEELRTGMRWVFGEKDTRVYIATDELHPGRRMLRVGGMQYPWGDFPAGTYVVYVRDSTGTYAQQRVTLGAGYPAHEPFPFSFSVDAQRWTLSAPAQPALVGPFTAHTHTSLVLLTRDYRTVAQHPLSLTSLPNARLSSPRVHTFEASMDALKTTHQDAYYLQCVVEDFQRSWRFISQPHRLYPEDALSEQAPP